VNERRSLNIRRTLFRLVFDRPGLVLVLGLALGACLSSQPYVPLKASHEAFSQLAKRISALRQLELKRELTLEQDSGDATAPASKTYDAGMAPALIESVYKIAGLLSDDANLNNALAEYRHLQRLAPYDPASGKILLTRDAARLAATLEKSHDSVATELPPVFGLMAGLQEQHFRWRAKIDSLSLEDRRLAFRAVAAGDMLLTLLASAAGARKDELPTENLQVGGQIGDALEKLGARLPVFFRRQLSFPYRHGSRFVWWALKARGWNGVNGLYANPPLSTAEILHPEKYFVQRQLPRRFFPPALLRRFREGPVVEQSFGEYLTGALLAPEHGASTAERLAAAWHGDQLFVFDDGRSLATVWFSSWQDENHAQEFMGAYRRVLEARHRLRFERRVNDKSRPLIAAGRDGRGWLIEARGSSVIAVSGASVENSIDLAKEGWQDLEIELESTAIPFESARRFNQFSSSKK
jgi:hypothetical protein